jgi:hypothetical protein
MPLLNSSFYDCSAMPESLDGGDIGNSPVVQILFSGWAVSLFSLTVVFGTAVPDVIGCLKTIDSIGKQRS